MEDWFKPFTSSTTQPNESTTNNNVSDVNHAASSSIETVTLETCYNILFAEQNIL